MTWFERLRRVIETRDLSVEEVARRARVPAKSLYGYLKGDVDNPRGDIVKRLAHAVGLTEQALRYGDIPSNVVSLKKIPLLEMNKLGTLTASDDPLSVWDGVTNVSVPADIPDGSYGVTLVDESGGEDFKAGEIVICNPGADVTPGRYVIAVLTDEKQALFAQYRPAAHRNKKHFFLKQPSEHYPEIEVGKQVKGFVLARAIKHIRNI